MVSLGGLGLRKEDVGEVFGVSNKRKKKKEKRGVSDGEICRGCKELGVPVEERGPIGSFPSVFACKMLRGWREMMECKKDTRFWELRYMAGLWSLQIQLVLHRR